ncbi:hypothetical protein ABKV19_000821 [Rosa sericea]
MELQRSAVGLFLGFLVLSVAPLSTARFVVEKNSLRVTSPDKIKGKYDSAIGNFGLPQYGGSMSGAVIYPKENQKGCKEFSEFGLSYKSDPGALPTFLLVDRGDCFFALKVWNAQKAGASAVLVADNIEEALITMDTPEEDISTAKYIENITIPSALIEKSFGQTLKKAISSGDMVNVYLDWRESVPHPDDRVEYELWTNSNDECGVKCDMLMEFTKEFRGAAQILEKGGYTQFTPHYITWYCPRAFTLSKQCKSQCINHGRYCAPDPEQDFSTGYEGKDVVIENLRQLCVFKVANETQKPWVWWDYVTDFQIRCPMKEKKYNKECADAVIKSLGLDSKKIDKCMGDSDADSENPVLKEEQDAQDDGGVQCKCPPGFKGDGVKTCDDIDECKEKKACQCPECSCKNTWGSYDCSCSGNLLYIKDHDTCISKTSGGSKSSAWAAVWVILIGLAMASGGAYLVYKYRLRSYMDSEIRAIMAQYMPLDSQAEVPNHVNDEHA